MVRRFAVLFAGLGLICALPARAASHWIRLTSPHFELDTTQSEKAGTDTLQFYEQVREFFRLATPIEPERNAVLHIIQFEDPAEYQRFRPNQSASAYFVAGHGHEYIVLGDQAVKDHHAPIHEYLHVVVRHSGLKIPLWLNEGWAEVFSSLRPMGKEMAVGDLLPDRMKVLNRDKWLDFDELTSVDVKSPSYNEESRVGIFYAESWALVHMLFLSPDYKGNFGKFVNALNGGKTTAEACQTAFGKSSAQVYADLHSYFERKKLFGTLFSIPPDRQKWEITSTPLTDLDAGLMRAELFEVDGKREEAKTEYLSLEQQQPSNKEVIRGLGNIAWDDKKDSEARAWYRKAYDAGDKDAQMCYRLAKLEEAAGAAPAVLMPILQRALQSQPDYPQAEALLGIVQLQTRDFSGGLATLSGLRSVNEQDAASVYCGLAAAQAELGDLEDAKQNIASCRQRSKTPGELSRVERLSNFVVARSLPVAAVHFGEKQATVTGMLQGVDCSPQGNRIVVTLPNNKTVFFDLPPQPAIELPVKPVANVKFQCGKMQPIAILVDFAPPRSAMETSAGVVRRLIF